MSSRLPIIQTKGESASTDVSPVGDGSFAGNASLVSLGCAKNLVDSEVMLGALEQKGFRIVSDPTQAELIVVNTCAFLQSAVEEGLEKILELAELKQTARCRQLVVAGCMLERYRADLEASLPEVDRFLSTDELLDVGKLGETTEACLDRARRPYFLYDESMPRRLSSAGHMGYIKVAEGCDRPCAFCIIPKLRGGFRSRKSESIIEEARELLEEGVGELTLVAQDLTAFGSDRKEKDGLLKLLQKFSELEADYDKFWIRLLYAYPIGTTDDLIREISQSPVICSYLDLPLQHISHSVLKAMRRPLGARRTRELVERIRSLSPELALRSTFIVGFPGETEQDVEELESFIKEGHFAHVGVFSYSDEPEADSFSLADRVPDLVKEERRGRLMEAQQGVVAERLAGFIGRELEVLLEGVHRDTDLLLRARSEWQAAETDGEVIINDLERGQRPAVGDFARVRVTEVAGYDLVGTLI